MKKWHLIDWVYLLYTEVKTWMVLQAEQVRRKLLSKENATDQGVIHEATSILGALAVILYARIPYSDLPMVNINDKRLSQYKLVINIIELMR